MKTLWDTLTALIPQTAVVSPNLNIAELSACTIDEMFTLTDRNDKNFLPSVRMSCSCKCQIIYKKLYDTFPQPVYTSHLQDDRTNISLDGSFCKYIKLDNKTPFETK